MMVTHTQNFCSAFNPSKCTSTVVNTHTMDTHPEQWAANAAAPREQLGVCLAQGSHLSRGIVDGRECCTFTPPTNNLCRTWDSNPWPLSYKSDSLSIMPRLPLIWWALISDTVYVQPVQQSRSIITALCFGYILYEFLFLCCHRERGTEHFFVSPCFMHLFNVFFQTFQFFNTTFAFFTFLN